MVNGFQYCESNDSKFILYILARISERGQDKIVICFNGNFIVVKKILQKCYILHTILWRGVRISNSTVSKVFVLSSVD